MQFKHNKEGGTQHVLSKMIFLMKRKPLTVKYVSLWDTATPEQKIEYQKSLDDVYDYIFDKILEKLRKEPINTSNK